MHMVVSAKSTKSKSTICRGYIKGSTIKLKSFDIAFFDSLPSFYRLTNLKKSDL